MPVNKTNPQWRAQTQLVRGGTHRSEFAETNEAIFMTSGYVYETAEQAQRAFREEEERFIYSRFSILQWACLKNGCGYWRALTRAERLLLEWQQSGVRWQRVLRQVTGSLRLARSLAPATWSVQSSCPNLASRLF